MKKFIAAAAGLMLAGSMVSTAFADVSIKGDARARYTFKSNYILNDSTQDDFDSRVRLKFKGEMESGVYAHVNLKAESDPWNGDDLDLSVYSAYFGVPMGPVTLEAGMINTHLTDMVLNDVDTDGARLIYSDDMNTFALHFSQTSQEGPAVLPTMVVTDDEDSALLGAYYIGNMDPAKITAGAFYQGDTGDNDGMFGTVRVEYDAGVASVTADYAYYQEELTGTEGAGHAAYATVGVPIGDAGSVALAGGLTMDGAVMDAPVGFTMIGGDTQVSFLNVGELPGYRFTDTDGDGVFDETAAITIPVDTYFGGVIANYTIAEGLSLRGTAAYAQMECDDMNIDTSAWELGAKVTYAVNADTALKVTAGYLNVDTMDNAIMGVGIELGIKF